MEHPDIYGRIESFDQNLRSLDRRLRAVERRLSANKIDTGIVYQEIGHWIDPDVEDVRLQLNELKEILGRLADELNVVKNNHLNHANDPLGELKLEINTTSERIEEITRMQASLKADTISSMDSLSHSYISEISQLKDEIKDAKSRLQKQENMNRITIGNIRVPLELSGIVASVTLIITGYLIWTDRWEIIRSSNYPIILALLFAATVILKFLITNRETWKTEPGIFNH